MNVVCVKWGDKYPSLYANRLYSMVQRWLSLPHRFVCLTDDPTGLDDGIEVRPLLEADLTGWWHKLVLFKRQVHDLEGPTLFLDLDIVIVGGLDIFFADDADFRIIRDWTPSRRPNSSVFRLTIGAYPEVWKTFRSDPSYMARYKNDQVPIKQAIPGAPAWPDGWVVSFKSHCDAKGAEGEARIPPGARIVVFHGEPKPHEIADRNVGEFRRAPWIREYWR